MESTFSVFFNPPQVAEASPRASAKSGSRPLGNAPACRDTIKVSWPAEIAPVEVVAQPARAKKGKAKNINFISSFCSDFVLTDFYSINLEQLALEDVTLLNRIPVPSGLNFNFSR